VLNILAITSPIFALMGVGYASTRWGVFAKADMRVLGKFVLNLALPALIFKAMASRPVAEVFNATYLVAYALGSLGAMAVVYAVCRRGLGLAPIKATFCAMGCSCSNSGFVGYPIVLLSLASVAGVSLALNMVVENLLVIPLLLFMAERARGSDLGAGRAVVQALQRLAVNPLVLGLVGGLLVSASGVTLPAPVARTVDMLAMASGAVSLLVIGGTLVGLPLRGLSLRVLPLALGKLVLHPFLVWLALAVLPWLGFEPLEPALHTAAVLCAAMPMMGIYPTLAQPHGQEEWTAVALLVTTVVSFLTLSAWLWGLLG
jgi:predicted permease